MSQLALGGTHNKQCGRPSTACSGALTSGMAANPNLLATAMPCSRATSSHRSASRQNTTEPEGVIGPGLASSKRASKQWTILQSLSVRAVVASQLQRAIATGDEEV